MTTRSRLYSIFALSGAVCYALALTISSLLWPSYALKPLWMAWGTGAVVFFFLSSWLAQHKLNNIDIEDKKFLRIIFLIAFAIRVVYVIAIGYYYYYQTGSAFEYVASDSILYHDTAKYMARCIRQGRFAYAYQYLRYTVYPMGFSDQGYLIWLSLVYSIFGNNLLVPRLLKALMGAYACVAIYRLALRCTDKRTAMLSAIICAFMPTLIHYNGLHLKETEMMFVAVLAIERTDNLIRSRKYTFLNIALPVFFTVMTFGFRTVLGMSVLFAYMAFIVLAPNEVIKRRTKIIASTTIILITVAFTFTIIGNEMKVIYRLKDKTTGLLVEKYEKAGLSHAELAQNKYLAPGVFVLPMATFTEVGNANQKMMNGDTYVKNFLAAFVMWAFIVMIRRKEWRNMSLVTSFVIAYAGIIALSFFVTSERYHFPLLPFYAIMAAYTITHFKRKDFPFFYVYCVLLVLVLIGWNYIKLSARGLV